MAKSIIQQSRFSGISYSDKEGITSSYLFGRSVDYRKDPNKITILPKTMKVSGSVVTDLILDATRVNSDLVYLYGNAGNIYRRIPSTETWTLPYTAGNSHGNGIKYFGEDDFLYYTTDKTIGRYGQINATFPTWIDDFMGAQGGVPLNTASMDLEAGSSMYVTAADSASLSITGDLTLEGWFKNESLPAAASEMALVTKWNGDSDERSYGMSLAAISAYFGDGGDGALTISSNTTEAPIDSACTGTAASYSLTATNASFATDQKILIHQSRGTGAGKWERNSIASYTAGTITLSDALINSYTSGAQVRVLPEYTNVTINSGITYTAKAWNGTVGGILAFLASGTVTVTGTITANGSAAPHTSSCSGMTGGGFRGGSGRSTSSGTITAYSGEGTAGAQAIQNAANGNGGGGGYRASGSTSVGGGGGANGGAGQIGEAELNCVGGQGGATAGTADLTTMVFGGGGGGRVDGSSTVWGCGASGGGIVFITGVAISVGGSITANGGMGSREGGGGGGGGSVLLKSQTATLGTALITATGGAKDSGNTYDGGAGGTGRIHLDYYTSYTGTTSPALDYAQDNNLVTSTTYQLKFFVSSDGTTANQEFLSKTITAPTLATWYHYAVTWDASASKVTYYVGGVSQGTAVGVKTAAYDGTALFAIGAQFNAAGAAENFFDGKFDEVRVWNDIRTTSELYNNKETEISVSSPNLQGYWQVDSASTDGTANANNLTLVNTPTYDTADVPFASPTTRQDLDQSLDTSGQTAVTAVAISEGVTARQSFVPAKDPQKSIQINVADTGDDPNWTITVHDAQNRLVASKTIAYAQMTTGDVEFVFDEVWRPVLGQTYHFHITASTVTGAPAVVSTTSNDMETADFHTYYQFLVDKNDHPIEQILNKLVIGNERYLATWDGIVYSPHRLTLPAGYTIHCLAVWREYVVLGVILGSSVSDFDYGYLFFWDGNTDTYNFYLAVPEGAINAMMSGDPLYFVAGDMGDLMKYEGGKPSKIRRFPYVGSSEIEVYRKGITMWKSLVRIAFVGESDDTSLERGVYSWGTLHMELPETLSFDYPVSLGIAQLAGLQLGMVYPVGQDLLISWRNNGSYGVDKVNADNNPFATATIEFLISDIDNIYKEKQAMILRAYFKELESGDTYKLKYKIDRNSTWTEGSLVSTANLKEARLTLPTRGGRFNEFQFAVDIGTSNTTSPEFYGIGFELENLRNEGRV